MGRPKKQSREPYWLTKRQSWYVHSGSRTIRLSPDKDEAYRLWHEMMAKPAEEQAAAPLDTRLVAVILDTFLSWVKANKAVKTYTWNRDHIQTFLDSIPPALQVSELKPWHVSRVMDAKPNWSASTKNGFARSVQRAFRWAKKQGIIDLNPIDDVDKPGGQPREKPVTPAEFDRLMDVVKEGPFRDLLIAAWDSGARPAELMRVEARHLDGDRWVFQKKESKGNRACASFTYRPAWLR